MGETDTCSLRFVSWLIQIHVSLEEGCCYSLFFDYGQNTSLTDKNTPVNLFLLLSITTTPEPALLCSCLFLFSSPVFPAKHYTQNKIDQLKSRQFNNLSVVGWNYAGRATTLFPLSLLHDCSLQNVGWLAGWFSFCFFVFFLFVIARRGRSPGCTCA